MTAMRIVLDVLAADGGEGDGYRQRD